MNFLAACCTVKNEAAIILEWMAFHRAAGVEKLIIIDNGSTDDTVEIIRSFRDQDNVELILWPERTPQIEMYEAVVNRYRGEVEWCAFIDADEFLYPVDGTDLRHTLATFGDVGLVGVHWHIYGSSGHLTNPEGLVIDNYLNRAEDGFAYNHHVKSIVRLRHAVRPYTSHLFEVKNGCFDDAGNELEPKDPYGLFPDKEPTYTKMRINHYHCRSRAEYMKKAMRGYFGVDDAKLQGSEQIEAMFQSHDQNKVFDDTALKFKPLMEFYTQPDPRNILIPADQFHADMLVPPLPGS